MRSNPRRIWRGLCRWLEIRLMGQLPMKWADLLKAVEKSTSDRPKELVVLASSKLDDVSMDIEAMESREGRAAKEK